MPNPSTEPTGRVAIEAAELRRLRAEIGRLTGRVVVSMNLPYLRTRLATLEKRRERGDCMPNENPDPASRITISLTTERTALLDRICAEKRAYASTIMRDAFDAWARANGYSVEISHIHRIADRRTTNH